jgi:hypothetical protein
MLVELVLGGTQAFSRSSRVAILSVIAFFIVGGAILALVNVKTGEQAACDADARVLNVA